MSFEKAGSSLRRLAHTSRQLRILAVLIFVIQKPAMSQQMWLGVITVTSRRHRDLEFNNAEISQGTPPMYTHQNLEKESIIRERARALAHHGMTLGDD